MQEVPDIQMQMQSMVEIKPNYITVSLHNAPAVYEKDEINKFNSNAELYKKDAALGCVLFTK